MHGKGRLQRLYSRLERRVRERNEELSKAKEHLEAEVVERKRAEAALQIKARELEFLSQRLSEMRQALWEAREEPERWMPSFSISSKSIGMAQSTNVGLGSLAPFVLRSGRTMCAMPPT